MVEEMRISGFRWYMSLVTAFLPQLKAFPVNCMYEAADDLASIINIAMDKVAPVITKLITIKKVHQFIMQRLINNDYIIWLPLFK